MRINFYREEKLIHEVQPDQEKNYHKLKNIINQKLTDDQTIQGFRFKQEDKRNEDITQINQFKEFLLKCESKKFEEINLELIIGKPNKK